MKNFLHSGALPATGSDVAEQWNHLYDFLVGMSFFFLLIVVGAMLLFIWKYRNAKESDVVPIKDHHALELFWTLVPTALVMGLFVWGYVVYRDMIVAPTDAVEIRVIGKQWLWNFQYPNGEILTNKLIVPANKPVKLIMTSEDVLHSFFIPAMRVKKDVVPGMYSSIWFKARESGRYQVFCAEYCGAAHSGMLASMYAVDQDNWERFLSGRKLTVVLDEVKESQAASNGTGGRPTLVEQGQMLTKTKGCIACHSEDGSSRIGPSYKGVFESEVELTDGSKVIADENYIRESIEFPLKKVVKGFAPTMPSFKGLIKEEEMNAILAYIKSLK